MGKLPHRFAPYVFGAIQAALTTAVATAIATYQLTGLTSAFLSQWSLSWLLAWLTMLPIVFSIAPLIQGAVVALTARENGE